MKTRQSASDKTRTTAGAKRVPETRAKSSSSPRRKGTKKSATSVAIATELAPAVAIALLEKATQGPNEPAAALDALAAGVSASETEGKVRVQLLFENGAVLPVEMSAEAGVALSNGLADEIANSK
jgi:hypothetical protein